MPHRKTANAWVQVGTAIHDRRLECRLAQRELAERVPMNVSTLRAIEHGEPRGEPTDITQARICAALGWTHDSIKRILEGGEPELLPNNHSQVTDQPPYVPAAVASQGLAEMARLVDLLNEHSRRLGLLEAEVESLRHRASQSHRESQ